MKNKKNIILAIPIFIFLAIIVAIIVHSKNSSHTSVGDQLELGRRYLNELNYEQAIASFNSVIEIDPQNADAYLGLSDAYAGLEDPDGLVGVYNRALDNLSEEDLGILASSISAKLSTIIDDALANKQYDRAESIIEQLKVVDSDKANEYKDILDNLINPAITSDTFVDPMDDVSDESKNVEDDDESLEQEAAEDQEPVDLTDEESDEEIIISSNVIPNVVGMDLGTATNVCSQAGFSSDVIITFGGNGLVTSQAPSAGTVVDSNDTKITLNISVGEELFVNYLMQSINSIRRANGLNEISLDPTLTAATRELGQMELSQIDFLVIGEVEQKYNCNLNGSMWSYFPVEYAVIPDVMYNGLPTVLLSQPITRMGISYNGRDRFEYVYGN